MDLEFAEEQQMLRETVRSLFAQHASFAVVRAMEDDEIGYPSGLWSELGKLGLIGLTLPEEYGGTGQSTLEAAVLYEEIGRSLAPTPHFPSAVIGGGVLARAGSEAQKASWLPRIASGEAIVTPAWIEPGSGFGPSGVGMRAVPDGSGGDVRLSGTKPHVLFARSASALLVLARTGDAPTDVGLFLVDPNAPGITLTQQKSLASDTQYQVDFADVRLPATDRVGGWAAWHEVLLEGATVLAAQAVGGAARALEMTVDYAKTRHQFGKPLAAFQAISHYLADASTAVDGATTLAYEAAWASARGRPIARLAPMAKLFACRTYRDVTAMALQVHGGMGFTVELDIQLFFRRAKQLQISWWDSRHLEDLIAADVLDGRAA